MNLLGKLLLIAGIGLAVYGGFESSLLVYGTAQPQAIALSDLGRTGKIANVHVTVSEFTTGEGLVVESKDDRWTRVWVPLLKPDGSWTERPVVAYVTGVQNEAELAAKIEHPALTGVITNGVQSLGSKQREQFAPQYPNVDLSNAIAFHVGRRFPTAIVTVPLLLLGIVFLAAGGYLTFWRF
jgi:hypothetical protein